MSTTITDSDWERVLDAMREANLRTIIVQYLRHDDEDLYSTNPAAFDATEKILTYCDAHSGMRVFLGLGYVEAWYTQFDKPEFLHTLADKNQKLATFAWTRYGGRHKSLAGWYIPQEMWNRNYTDDEIRNLREIYYAPVSKHCKKLSSDLPVAVAPFFNPSEDYLKEEKPSENAEKFAASYARFLEGAKIDIVMLQDHVGAVNVSPNDFDGKIKPYYAAFKRLCLPRVKEFWADVEAFYTVDKDHRRPADPDRFLRQLKTVSPFVTRSVAFEFFHYMNPHGHLKPADYAQEQKRLYDAYVRELSERN
jgi:hypothetical protein